LLKIKDLESAGRANSLQLKAAQEFELFNGQTGMAVTVEGAECGLKCPSVKDSGWLGFRFL
jgi:hypothetical protein